jgi:hypothetical protein
MHGGLDRMTAQATVVKELLLLDLDVMKLTREDFTR